MTTVITRLYADSATAHQVMSDLAEAGHPAANCDMIAAGGDVTAAMIAARVSEENAAAYAPHIAGDATLVVVRAPITPFGAARNAMGIVDAHPSMDAGAPNPNEYIREEADPNLFVGLSVMRDHPRFFSSDMRPGTGQNRGPVTPLFGMKLLSHKTRKSAQGRAGHMSTKFLPFKLLSEHKDRKSLTEHGPILSRIMGMPTLAHRN